MSGTISAMQSPTRVPVQLIDASTFGPLIEQARRSPRRRTNFNFHASFAENPNRFLNILAVGTYVRPHRHLLPPKPESFLILEGKLALFTFDDAGRTPPPTILGHNKILGVDIAPGVWHSLVVLSPHAVLFEVKPGPYDPGSDKDFAPWAPPEDGPAAAAYVAKLVGIVEQNLSDSRP